MASLYIPRVIDRGERPTPPAWCSPDAAAWGEVDQETGLAPIQTPQGLWFTLDLKTGEVISPESPASDLPPTNIEYRKILHESADGSETRSLCYFIGADEGPIKIGHSIDVETRLRSFQAGCPVKLRVFATAPGGEAREIAYHWQFQEHRAHGEWFERHPDILAEIERLQND